MFNIFGSVLFTFVCMLTPFVSWMETLTPGNPVSQIANVHTTFNIVTTLILLPFGTLMAKMAVRILPDSKKADDEELRLKYIRPFDSTYSIGQGAVVISQLRDEVGRMHDMVAKNINDAYNVLIDYDGKARNKVGEREEYIDYLNKGISEYIVSMMGNEKSLSDSKYMNGFYVIISNLERIGDHAVNLAEYADDLKKWDLNFSDNVVEELEVMKKQCLEALNTVRDVQPSNVRQALDKASAMEQKIDDTRDKYFKKQMQRLKKGKCKPQTIPISSLF